MKTIKAKNLPHSDESGQARLVHQGSALDDCGTGGHWGTWMTPKEEREYNDGMARLAEMD